MSSGGFIAKRTASKKFTKQKSLKLKRMRAESDMKEYKTVHSSNVE
jgi:hypothetical protein